MAISLGTKTVTINKALAKKAFLFTDKRFVKHATAIGQAILAWNYLHERLGSILDANARLPQMGRTIDAWYSTNMDRPRREMLRAMLRDPNRNWTAPRDYLERRLAYATEVNWILTESDKLEDTRNGIVHAPLYFIDPSFAVLFHWGDEAASKQAGIIPYDVTGNPRAKRLSGKDLLTEYRWFRNCCLVLAEYSNAIAQRWLSDPLPQRPQLPTREHQKNRTGQRRRRASK